jgi:uncharacterized protein (DUF1330 family)
MTGVEYPMLMVAELAIHDWRAFSRYGREAVPLIERFGGRVLAMSDGAPRPVEGNWRPSTISAARSYSQILAAVTETGRSSPLDR